MRGHLAGISGGTSACWSIGHWPSIRRHPEQNQHHDALFRFPEEELPQVRGLLVLLAQPHQADVGVQAPATDVDELFGPDQGVGQIYPRSGRSVLKPVREGHPVKL